jgi:hypothetical protein
LTKQKGPFRENKNWICRIVSRLICEGTDASNHNEKSIETVVVGMEGKAEHTKEGNTVVADIEHFV